MQLHLRSLYPVLTMLKRSWQVLALKGFRSRWRGVIGDHLLVDFGYSYWSMQFLKDSLTHRLGEVYLIPRIMQPLYAELCNWNTKSVLPSSISAVLKTLHQYFDLSSFIVCSLNSATVT
ncbi:hypothetical protein ACLKA6_017354, partial [Drosophila palustris]